MRYEAGRCKQDGCGRPVEHIPGGYVHSDNRAATCNGRMGGPQALPDFSREG